jgi:hypothetical protein
MVRGLFGKQQVDINSKSVFYTIITKALHKGAQMMERGCLWIKKPRLQGQTNPLLRIHRNYKEQTVGFTAIPTQWYRIILGG